MVRKLGFFMLNNLHGVVELMHRILSSRHNPSSANTGRVVEFCKQIFCTLICLCLLVDCAYKECNASARPMKDVINQ